MSDFQQLIESNRRLTEAVEQKTDEIDQKVANAIGEMESLVSSGLETMTAHAIEGHKKAIEE